MTIEQYLRALRKACRARGLVSGWLLDETADHLQDIRDQELARGATPVEAERIATELFGHVDEVARRMATAAQARTDVLTRTPRRDAQPAPARPRGPGFAYGALALVLATVVGALTITSRRSPPPTIAEFAPQAVEQITQPGDGAGTDGAASAQAEDGDEGTQGEGADAQRIDVARVRQCVGDPPRQIEDPQSPPCVPYWSGDNGGATWRGVTRDEIRVVAAGEYAAGLNEPLVAFFNRRFEFYGRRIHLITRQTPGPEEEQRAFAQAVHEQERAFASFSLWWKDLAYFDELMRLGIVGVQLTPLFAESYLAKRRPYGWTYTMASDRLFATAGSWYCARLAGRNAVHAGDPVLQASPRRPGIIVGLVNDWDGTSAEAMNAQLGSCGQRTDAVLEGRLRAYDSVAYEAFMQNAMLQMKAWGVTTLACFCDWQLMALGTRAATNQGYFPEWVLSSYIGFDFAVVVRLYAAPEQTKSVMALTASPMERGKADHPSSWAFHDSTGSDADCQECNDSTYRPLLLLASGLQLAGPRLTPETFERGLHRARFPNPAHPIMAGAVGFEDGDHSMTQDVAEVWWSNSAPAPYVDRGTYGAFGTYCYVDHGTRRRIGTFPRDDPFFSGSCDNGAV